MHRASRYAAICFGLLCLHIFFPTGPTHLAALPSGTALQFDGVNDRVAFGLAPALGATNFTVETWFMRQGPGVAVSSGAGGVVAVPLVTRGMAEAEGSNKDENYFLGIDAKTGALAADFEEFGPTNAGLNHPIVGTTRIMDGVWYHAAVTYDSTTGAFRLYLNGSLDGSLNLTPGIRPRFDSIQHAALGTAFTSSGAFSAAVPTTNGAFQGLMDEVRIWNVARSMADINTTKSGPLTPPQTGLIGRWALDEGTATTAADSAGATNGTLGGSTPTLAGGVPVWVGSTTFDSTPRAAGDYGLKLTGLMPGAPATGDYVALGPAPALGAKMFTLEAWIKRTGGGTPTATGGVTTPATTLTSAIPLITKGMAESDGGTQDANYFFGINSSDGKLAADFEDMATGANHRGFGLATIAPDSVWHHVAVTFDGANWQFYLDGLVDGPPTVVGNFVPRFDSSQHAAIGSALQTNGAVTGQTQGFFMGAMDEVRIWNYARSLSQISSGKNREISTASGLLGRWSFNEPGQAIDATGHVPNGTMFGAGWTSVTGATTVAGTPALNGTPNTAPIVNAGADQTITLPAPALLNGSVNDDLVTGALTITWTKTSGPGTVTFLNASLASTSATFSAPGAYVLTLSADDGELSAISRTVNVQVNAAGGTNVAPTANAGPDQTITFPSQAALTGTYTDDGLPGVDVSSEWSKVSGPGTVTFAQPLELNTAASFSTSGTYVLMLTVNDGALPGTDMVTVTVSAAAISNYAIDFGGTNAYVDLGTGVGASAFTVEAWIRRDGTGVSTSTGNLGIAAAVPIVTKGRAEADGDTRDMNYFLGLNGNVLVADFEDMATGLNHPVSGTISIPANGAWHHVAVTYDGTKTWRLYVDGAPDGSPVVLSGTFAPRSDSIQHAAIGSAVDSSGAAAGFFDGAIDEVRIWNIVRTAQQIDSAKALEIQSDPNLIGRWGLNEGTGTTVADSSGHVATKTIAGASWAWTPGAPVSSVPNFPPSAPILNAPANAETGVRSPATLSVKVTDGDNDPMSVTFYGRQKPTTAPDFTLATLPDTQFYSERTTYAATFTAQTNWIVANRAPMNIAFVSHLGDVTQDADANEDEWKRADTSMSVLDASGIPYGMSPGNHDESAAGVAAFYDKYFPVSRFLRPDKPWYMGYLGQEVGDPVNRENKNNYELFSVGSLDFLVIHIEIDWPDYSVTWADKIIKRYPNRRVILSTHAFLNTSNARPAGTQFGRSNGTSAEAVWQQLIKLNCNVFMVINGHYPGEGRRTDLNTCGQPVHQVLMDYQGRINGGDGWLRYFSFKPSENKIYAYTYSPTRNGGAGEFETDDSSQFVLDYNMNGSPFSVVATQSNVASGSNATGSWSGLALGAQYEWYATASDGKVTTTGPTWSFTAAATANTAPVAVGDSYSTNEDATLTVTVSGVAVNDIDAENDSLRVALISNVSHGTLTLNADGSFTYTPAASYSGPDGFTYKANDGTLDSNVATVSIVVAPVNDAPAAADGALITAEDTPVSGTLVATDVDSAALIYSIVANGAKGTASITNPATGAFAYTPKANANGADSITFKASDGTAESNVATVAITINAANDAPVAADGALSTTEDAPASGMLVATDVDADALTYSIVANGAKGTAIITDAATGAFTYTLKANANGADSITFKASDGTAESNVATVAITINVVNDEPVAADGALSTTEDLPASGILVATDVDADSLIYSIVASGAKGTATITDAATGAFTYTPKANANGADSITFKASDGTAESNVATVAITINAANDAPVAADGALSTTEDMPASGMLVATDVDADAFTYSIVANGAKGTATITDVATGAFTYTPNINANGADTITFTASDGSVASNTATVTITIAAVNDAPVAADGALSTTEDASASGTLVATDIDADALTYSIVANGAKGTAVITNPATGAFTYTPNANANGTDSITFKASDGSVDSNTGTVAITISEVNDKPVAANDSYSTGEDTSLTIPAPGVLVNDTDADGDVLSTGTESGPSHGALTLNADGSFTYTPNANYNGPDSFTYAAYDASSESNVATVSLTVNAVNDAPAATNDSYDTNEDTPLTIAASGVLGNDSDIDSATLTAVLVAGPTHGTLGLNANGGFLYTPAANYNGADSFTYTANDGSSDSSIATVSITVNAVNDAPAATNDSYSTNEDTPLTLSASGVLGNDSDIDSATLRAVLVTGPKHGTLSLNADGGFLYTPAANYNGADSFTYKSNDGSSDSNVATVSITVNAANDAPAAADDSYGTFEDMPLAIAAAGVLSNDTDAEGDSLKAALVSGPSHGTLAFNADGSFAYTPAADYYGPDSFTYRVNDGVIDSNVATVSLIINPVNDAPVAADDSYGTNEDTQLTVAIAASVLSNDGDVDGDSLKAVLVTGPSHGTLNLNANGSFTYVPAANYNGTDSFTYRASEGTGTLSSSVATVTIAVNAVNDAPAAQDQAALVNFGSAKSITLGAQDLDNDALTFRIVAGPTHGGLSGTGRTPTYTPAAGYTGPDSFTFVANDGQADSNVATVSITVASAPGTPTAYSQTVTLKEDAFAAITLTASDPDKDKLKFTVVVGPTHGRLSGSGSSVFYSPDVNYYGTDSFTFHVTDATHVSNDAVVTLKMTAVNDEPLASNLKFVTAKRTAITGRLVATDLDGDPITYRLLDEPNKGTITVNAATGVFTYTPTGNGNGSDQFTYTANDGKSNGNTATVHINIRNAAQDRRPVASNLQFESTRLAPLSNQLVASDDDDDVLTFRVISQPSTGTVTLDQMTGAFTYTPDSTRRGGGTDHFRYVASDGIVDSNVATVRIDMTDNGEDYR